MADLGRAALVVTLGLALYALVAGITGALTHRRRLSDSARIALIVSFGSTLLASVVLAAALVRSDFTFTYVVTHTSSDLPVWYDVMMLIWFAFTGLLLGMVSLFLMQEIVRREFGRWVGWAFVAAVTALSAAGVYMGRFLRWNSWDILRDPTGIALYSFERVQDPSLQSIGFIGLFGGFFLFLYITLYTFGHLLLERPTNP